MTPQIAFLPAVIALALWGGSHLLAFIARIAKWRLPPFQQWTYVLLIVTTILSLLTCISIGDISLEKMVVIDKKAPKELTDVFNSFNHYVTYAIGAGLAAFLLPVFSPRRLLQSGQRKSGLQSLVFKISSVALLSGVPLFVFYFLCREDVSDWNRQRPDADQLTPSHLHRIDSLYRQLNTTETPDSVERRLRDCIAETNVVDDIECIQASIDEDTRSRSLLTRWIDFLTSLESDAMFLQRVNLRKDLRNYGTKVTKAVNEKCLSDPYLFSASDLSPEQRPIRRKAIDAGKIIRTALAALPESVTDQEEFRPVLVEMAAFNRKVGGVGTELSVIDGLLKPELEKDTTSASRQSQVLQSVASVVRENLRIIREANWELLNLRYPDHVKSPKTIFAYVVNEEDQRFRLRIALMAGLAFVGLGLLINLNQTCLHGAYSAQLAEIWLPSESPLRLSKLRTCENGGPLQLFNATINRMGKREDPDVEQKSRFVMSSLFCGSRQVQYRRTSEYEHNDLTVADAMAISGAAVSTVSADGLLYQVMLFVTNMRLGQWLRNPQHFHKDNYWPSPFRVLLNQLWNPAERSYLSVTDGGHLDNLGLSALLERRCKLIIVADAGFDPTFAFDDLLSVLQAARAKYGLKIEDIRAPYADRLKPSQQLGSLDVLRPWRLRKSARAGSPADLQQTGQCAVANGSASRNADFCSEAHAVIIEVSYPPASPGEEPQKAVIIFAKSTLTGDEPLDVLELSRNAESGFPFDATVDQFLPPERFEAYVTLGRHTGLEISKLCDSGWFRELHALGNWGGGTVPRTEATAARLDLVVVAKQLCSDSVELPSVSIDLVLAVLECTLVDPSHFAESGLSIADITTGVSNWSRERLSNEQRPRILYCRGLIDIVNRFESVIAASRELSLEYLSMLQCLARNMRQAQGVIKKLAECKRKAHSV